jgi:rod shape-determining protein MreC
MTNLFLFIRKYSNLLLFLVLQVFCLYTIFRYNRFHEAAFLGMASEVTGKINQQYDGVEYYFRLKKTNEQLVQENLQLRNALKSNIEAADTARRVFADTLTIDTLGNKRINVKYVWMEAKVVSNAVSGQNNFMTIHRGSNQGVKKDMGVISPQGVVGTVVSVSGNFAIVMPMINRLHSVSAVLKNSPYTGNVKWDGSNPAFVTLFDLSGEAQVKPGDTVLTSNYTRKYPQGIMVGVVKEVTKDKSKGTFTLKLKTATNFYNVEFVYLVDNLQKEEQQQLEQDTRKKLQQQQ